MFHIVSNVGTTPASAQHREASTAMGAVAVTSDAAKVVDQHAKDTQHSDPAKRLKLCKKLEARRAELRQEEKNRMKKPETAETADSAAAAGK